MAPWIVWRLWKNRNEMVFKGKEMDAQSVVQMAGMDVEEWENRKENKGNQRIQAISHQIQVRWMRPPQDWVKCNIDGAWPREGNHCRIGWVLRNHLGQVLWLGERALPRPKSVIEVEAEALRWAVLSMARFRYDKIIFESDSKELIMLLVGEERRPLIDPLLQDIQNSLHHFAEVKLVYAKREGNEVADRIAKESISFQNYDPKLYSIVQVG